jgi:heme A synthase
MQKAGALETQRRTRAFPISLRSISFEHFALATILLTYGLIVLGGTVRATDSGTACPDWPLCHGRVFPRIEEHVLIEYSHRLVASLVGMLILFVVVWAWRRRRDDIVVRVAAPLAFSLLVVQVLVGAATVNTETDATVVAVHLSIALTLFAALIVLSLAASGSRVRSVGAVPAFPIVVALVTFVLVITGAYVSQEGAGLVYRDWPLFDGKLVSSGGWLADLHWAHRVLAGMLGLLMLALAVRTWRNERRRMVLGAVALGVMIYVGQVFVGAANIWFDLATELRISHLALASALWGVLVFAAAWSYLRPTAGDGVR